MMTKAFRKRAISILVLLCIAVSSISLALISAKYAGIDIIDGLKLILQGKQPEKPDDEYVEGEELEPTHSEPGAYHILYITYNGKQNVIAAEDIYTALTDIVDVRGEINNTANNYYSGMENCEFIGWSTTGMVSYTEKYGVEDYSDNMGGLYNGNRVSLAKLVSERGTQKTLTDADFDTVGGIDAVYEQFGGDGFVPAELNHPSADTLEHTYILLYDMYRGGPTLEIQPHSDMLSTLSGGGTVLVNPYACLFPMKITGLDNIDENKFANAIYNSGSYFYITEEFVTILAIQNTFGNTDIGNSITDKAHENFANIADAAGEAAMNGGTPSPVAPSIDSSYDTVCRDELYGALSKLFGSVYEKRYTDAYAEAYDEIYEEILLYFLPSMNSGATDTETAEQYADFYAETCAELSVLGMWRDVSVFVDAAAERAIARMVSGDSFEDAVIYGKTFAFCYAAMGEYEYDNGITAEANEVAENEYLEVINTTALAMRDNYKQQLNEYNKTPIYAQAYAFAEMMNANSAERAAAKYEELVNFGYDNAYALLFTIEYETLYEELLTKTDEGGSPTYTAEQIRAGAQAGAEYYFVVSYSKALGDSLQSDDEPSAVAVRAADMVKNGKSAEYALAYTILTVTQNASDNPESFDRAVEDLVRLYNELKPTAGGKYAQGYAAGYAQLIYSMSDYAEPYAPICAKLCVETIEKGYSPAEAFAVSRKLVETMFTARSEDMLYSELFARFTLAKSEQDNALPTVMNAEQLASAAVADYNTVKAAHGEAYADVYMDVYVELLRLGYFTENEKKGTLDDTSAKAYAHTIAAKYTELTEDGMSETAAKEYVAKYAYAGIRFSYEFYMNTWNSILLATEYADKYFEFIDNGLNVNMAETYAALYCTTYYDIAFKQGYGDEYAKQYAERYMDMRLNTYSGIYETAFASKYSSGDSAAEAHSYADKYALNYISFYTSAYIDKESELTASGELTTPEIIKRSEMYAETFVHLMLDEEGFTTNTAKIYASAYVAAYNNLIADGWVDEGNTALLEQYAEDYASLYGYAVVKLGESELYAQGYAKSSLLQYISKYDEIKATLQQLGAITESSAESDIEGAVRQYIGLYSSAYAEKYEELRNDGVEKSTAETAATLYADEYIYTFKTQLQAQLTGSVSLDVAMGYAHAYAKMTAKGKDTAYASNFASAYTLVVASGLNAELGERYATVYADQCVELSDNDKAWEYTGLYVTSHMGALRLGKTAEQADIGARAYVDAYLNKYAEFAESEGNDLASFDADDYAPLYAAAYLNMYEKQLASGNNEDIAKLAAEGYAKNYANFYCHAYDGMMDESFASADVVAHIAELYAKMRADLISEGTADDGEDGAHEQTKNYINAYIALYKYSNSSDAGDYEQTQLTVNAFNQITGRVNPPDGTEWASNYAWTVEYWNSYNWSAAHKKDSSDYYAKIYAEKYAEIATDRAAKMYAELYNEIYTRVYNEQLAERGGILPTDETELQTFLNGVAADAAAQAQNRCLELANEFIDPFAKKYAETYARVYTEIFNFDYVLDDQKDNAHADTVATEFASLFEAKFNEVHDAKRAELYYEYASISNMSNEQKKFIMNTAYLYAEGYALCYVESFAIMRYTGGVTDDSTALAKAAEFAKMYDETYEEAYEYMYHTFGTIDALTDAGSYESHTMLAMYASAYAEKYVEMYAYMLAEDNNLSAIDGETYASAFAECYALQYIGGADTFESSEIASSFAEIYARLVTEYGASDKVARAYSYGYAEGYALEAQVWNDKSTPGRYYGDIVKAKKNELIANGMSEEEADEKAHTYAFAYQDAYIEAYADRYAVSFMSQVSQFDELLSQWVLGLSGFNEMKHYALTNENQSVKFRIHAGLTITSGSSNSAGSYSVGETSVNYYLYLFANADTDVKTNGIFDSTKAANARYVGSPLGATEGLILYAYDTTPAEYVQKQESLNISKNPFADIEIPEIEIDACFATGTMITLADGTKKPVEELTENDILRVYDHENGAYTYAPALIVDFDGNALYTIAHLEFADGEDLELINERGLFDITLNQYVYITPDNCEQFIGHLFAKETDSDGGFEAVELTDAYKTVKVTGCYSVASTYYINHFIDGYLTVPGAYHWFVNYFEYGDGTAFENGDDLKYNEEKLAEDIETYGLLTADEIMAIAPELLTVFSEDEIRFLFDNIYPAKYLKIAMGKKLVTFDEVIQIVKNYIIEKNLSDKFSMVR